MLFVLLLLLLLLLLFFQWTGFVFLLTIAVMCNLSTASLWLHDQ